MFNQSTQIQEPFSDTENSVDKNEEFFNKIDKSVGNLLSDIIFGQYPSVEEEIFNSKHKYRFYIFYIKEKVDKYIKRDNTRSQELLTFIRTYFEQDFLRFGCCDRRAIRGVMKILRNATFPWDDEGQINRLTVFVNDCQGDSSKVKYYNFYDLLKGKYFILHGENITNLHNILIPYVVTFQEAIQKEEKEQGVKYTIKEAQFKVMNVLSSGNFPWLKLETLEALKQFLDASLQVGISPSRIAYMQGSDVLLKQSPKKISQLTNFVEAYYKKYSETYNSKCVEQVLLHLLCNETFVALDKETINTLINKEELMVFANQLFDNDIVLYPVFRSKSFPFQNIDNFGNAQGGLFDFMKELNKKKEFNNKEVRKFHIISVINIMGNDSFPWLDHEKIRNLRKLLALFEENETNAKNIVTIFGQKAFLSKPSEKIKSLRKTIKKLGTTERTNALKDLALEYLATKYEKHENEILPMDRIIQRGESEHLNEIKKPSLTQSQIRK